MLPLELLDMPNLRLFSAAVGNSLFFPPEEIVRQGWEATKSFLLEARASGTEPCNRLKIMLVGHTGEGKTSFLRAMKGYRLELPSAGREDRTFGVEQQPLTLWGCKPSKVDGDSSIDLTTLHTTVLDFAGQEMYYTTHAFFMSHRSLYVLVVNVSRLEEDDRMEKALQYVPVVALLL